MKRLITTLLLLVFLLSFNVVYAADNSADASKTTIAKLQETAVSSSRQALVDDLDIRRKEMAVRTVSSNANAMSDSILRVTKPIDVQLELDSAKKTKQDHLNQLKVDVYKAALNIQLCVKEIALQEVKLSVAEEKLNMAKARFKASSITQDSLDAAQYEVDSSRVDLENVKEKQNSQFIELRKLLNQTLTPVPVTIADELKLAAFNEIDMDSAINSLYKTETTVFKAAGKLDIAQKAMDIAVKLYTKGNTYYDNASDDLDEAKLNLASAKTALDVKIKNKYNDLLNRQDDVGLASKYAELASKKLANAQTKYDKGTISKETYLAAKVSLADAEYRKYSAIVGFNGVKADFDNMTAQ